MKDNKPRKKPKSDPPKRFRGATEKPRELVVSLEFLRDQLRKSSRFRKRNKFLA